MSIYQSEKYKQALLKNGNKIIDISPGYFATEKKIKIGFISKTIIEARGTPTENQAKDFKEIARKYFYGTIAATVTANNEIFEKLKYNKVLNHTILIDLKKDKEEIWTNLEKKSIRWGVKTAEKNGLTFSESTEKEREQFYKMYKKTTERGGFVGEKNEFIEEIVKEGLGKLFVIKFKEDIVAGGAILFDRKNNYAILDLTSANEEGQKLQAMPYLYWNFILYSKENKFDYFDLGGYDNEAKEGEKTYNINKFKERFGGKLMEQPIYSTNSVYPFFRKIMRKIKFMKGVYRKSDA